MMTRATEPIPRLAAALPPETAEPFPRRRWTEAEFDRLKELGFIPEESSAFLRDGDLILSLDDQEPEGSPLRQRWTEAEFDRMVESGIVREGSSTFLWDGEIIEPMAEDQPHLDAIFNLVVLLAARLPADRFTVNMNQPIPLESGYRPEPDFAILRGARRLFRGRGCRPDLSDIAVLIEVSDTSYSRDKGDLLSRYASGGIPQYWIVNIRARRIEVYNDPDPNARLYRDRKDYGLDAAVPLQIGADEFPPVAVIDVLRNSLDDGEPIVE